MRGGDTNTAEESKNTAPCTGGYVKKGLFYPFESKVLSQRTGRRVWQAESAKTDVIFISCLTKNAPFRL